MKVRTPTPTRLVKYSVDAAGIKAGTIKSLPLALAKEMISKGFCVAEGEEPLAPAKKEAKAPRETKELKGKRKTK